LNIFTAKVSSIAQSFRTGQLFILNNSTRFRNQPNHHIILSTLIKYY